MREDWEYRKLNEVCVKDSSNIVINKLNDNTGNYPLYGASGFIKGIDFYHQDKPYIGIVKDGAGVGRVGIYPAYSSLVGTMQYILPNDDCLIEYLKYFLVKLDLSKLVSGATIPHIYFKDYGKEIIPVPPREEQERIVSELDLLSGILEKEKAEVKELERLAESIFYDMFGDPVENERGWEVEKLSDFCSKIGSGATPRGGNESYKAEGISLIRSMNVHNNSFIYEDLAHIDEEQAKALDNVEVKHNDILLNITGASVARCCIVPNEILPARVNQHVCIIRPNAKANVIYLSRLLSNHSYQSLLIDLAKSKAATREALPKSIVDNLQITLPPLSLQREFAERIERIEVEKGRIRRAIEETGRLFDYTMERYFG